jgi:hypothetical protein
MTQPARCPFCGSDKILAAQFFSDGSAGALLRFDDIKQYPWWKFASANNEDFIRDVGVDDPTVCLACGMLWAKYNLAKTLRLVKRHGSPEMQAFVAAADAPIAKPPTGNK